MSDFIMMLFDIVAALAMFGLGLLIIVIDVSLMVVIFDTLIKRPKNKKERDKNDEEV